MKVLEAIIKVSPDGSAILHTGKQLKPGLHKIMIITDETADCEGDPPRNENKRLLDLKSIHVQGQPKNSTFRRGEIYNDDGR